MIARRALTSLVHPSDPSHNIAAVRSQVPLHELRDLAADAGGREEKAAVDAVIASLTRRRIITTQAMQDPRHPGAAPGEPVAELIHEALIRDWGALREWVDQEHRFQKWLGRTRERRARWATEKDPGDLLGGTALAEGLEWSGQRRLPADIESFLTVSRQRQRAVIRRSRRLNAVLGGLLVLALIAAGGLFGIVRVAALALTQDGHAGQAYIHNGPQALTTREQAEILADVPGRRESPGGRGVQHSMAVGFGAGNCVVDLVMLRQHPGHGTAC